MSQRSYFIQPKSGSDWSSSARLTDQEIMNEFDKMTVPTYFHQETTEPISSTDYNVIHRSSNESDYPGTCSYRLKEPTRGTGSFGRRTNTSNDLSFTVQMNTPLTNRIINAQGHPVELSENETITVLGQTGIYANRTDTTDWHGEFALNEYLVNEDASPEVIHKQVDQKVCLTQEIKVKYLRPPTPQPSGDIVIRQEANKQSSPAPPIVIRQKPESPDNPAPAVFHEAPPKQPACEKAIEITIPGKLMPPPPRQVVIERLPKVPAKPQQVTVERWLPFAQQKRRVVFQKEKETACMEKPRNLIIQWEPLQACIKKEFINLGVVECNPDEYVQRYGSSLIESADLPGFIKEIRPPSGVELACNTSGQTGFELVGDLDALSLVDNETLDRLGLRSYTQSGGFKQSRGEFANYESSIRYPAKSSKIISETEFEAYKWPRTSRSKMQTNFDMDQILSDVFGSVQKDSSGRITVDEAERVLENLVQKSNGQSNIARINRKQFIMSLTENGMVPMKKFELAVRSLD